ncbi:MAG: hypothetical protein ACI9HK_002951 [Pirellulaceae bacterium]|jgi:hypothetical protein
MVWVSLCSGRIIWSKYYSTDIFVETRNNAKVNHCLTSLHGEMDCISPCYNSRLG